MIMLTLKGRTAVVTGGSRNIGYAISYEFAKAGMNVAILSVHEDSATEAATSIADNGYSCAGYQCDVAELQSIKTALEKVNQRFGRIDVVVNSAGILDMNSILATTVDSWDHVMEINLRGAFLVMQQSIIYLEKSNAPRIINISSNAGRMGGFENGMSYTASKGGMISLTYGMARQLASKGITVNCITPGTIESDMLRARDEETRKRLLARFPMGRFGRPEEVAAAACYFASEEAGFTTGAVLDVNGGLFMG